MAEKQPETIDEEGLIDVEELAKRFGPPCSWWYVRAQAGDVPSYKLGKYRKFRLSEVKEWIAAQRQEKRTAARAG